MNRYWDQRVGGWIVQILPGELHVTRDAEVITTVLGSCVAACVRDVERGIGGMNHFMLPRAPTGDVSESARYGVYALELLLNDLMRRGGKRSALEVKVFGGGRVIECGGDIGAANIAFVRTFFATEHIPIVAEDVGAHYARRVRYWPQTGRVQLAQMPMATALVEERAVIAKAPAVTAGSVELF